MSCVLLNEYDGEVPANREALVTLPGVGRKTANVVLSVAFDIPAMAVDTHVERVSKRLRFMSMERFCIRSGRNDYEKNTD